MFDFSGTNSNTGNAEGTVTIYRGDSDESNNMKDFLLFLQNYNGNVAAKSDNTRVAQRPIPQPVEEEDDGGQ